MLAHILSLGQAASNCASIRSPPVVKAPSLSRMRSVSCALDQFSSSWLASTLKCFSRRAMTSGKTARATRIFGLLIRISPFELFEPDEGHEDEQGNQHPARPGHVAEETRHFHAAVFRHGFDHQKIGR